MKKIISIIILLLVIIPFSIKAEEYKVDELRECIVNNCKYKKELDYNNDKKIDILDLLVTRKSENVQYEESIKNDGTNFGKITGTAAYQFGQTKTKSTKHTTTRSSTIRKTTSRNTTSKRVPSNNNVGTTKTTKATTAAQMFNVSVSGNNATPDYGTKQAKSGGKATFYFTPEKGYVFSSVNCSNGARGSYGKENNILTVNYVNADTTCTLQYKKTSYSVNMKVINGTIGDTKLYVPIGEGASTTAQPKTGYTFGEITCTSGLVGSYSGNTVTISNANGTGTCTVKFKPIQYSITIKDNNGNTYLTGDYDYKATNATFSIKSTTRLNKQVDCNGKTYSASEYSSTSGGIKTYKYSLSMPVTENTVCTYTIK